MFLFAPIMFDFHDLKYVLSYILQITHLLYFINNTYSNIEDIEEEFNRISHMKCKRSHCSWR